LSQLFMKTTIILLSLLMVASCVMGVVSGPEHMKFLLLASAVAGGTVAAMFVVLAFVDRR